MARDSPVKSSDDYTVGIFINGMGGTKESSLNQAKTLSDCLTTHSGSFKYTISSAFNNGTMPRRPVNGLNANTACAKVLSLLIRKTVLANGADDTVRTVIFAHSHGGKVAMEALMEENLEAEIKRFYPERTVTTEIDNLRKRTVVITFGSICLVPKSYAKIVMNFCSPTDSIAYAFRIDVTDLTPKDEWAYYRSPEDPIVDCGPCTTKKGDALLDIAQHFHQSAGASGLSLPVSGSGSSRNSSSGDNGNDPHYFDNYMKQEEMMKHIVKTIEQMYKRQCKQKHEYDILA